MSKNFIIREANGAADMKIAKSLINEYMDELGVDLCFQGVDEELATLPGPYAKPDGIIYFGILEGATVPTAMIALKKLDDKTCEMKRLYVTPEHRSSGMGEALVKQLLISAKDMSYEIMRLDTLARLKPAIALYQRHGFVESAAYNDNHLDGITYFMKEL